MSSFILDNPHNFYYVKYSNKCLVYLAKVVYSHFEENFQFHGLKIMGVITRFFKIINHEILILSK